MAVVTTNYSILGFLIGYLKKKKEIPYLAFLPALFKSQCHHLTCLFCQTVQAVGKYLLSLLAELLLQGDTQLCKFKLKNIVRCLSFKDIWVPNWAAVK